MAILQFLGVSIVIVWGLAGSLGYFVYVREGVLDDASTFDSSMAQRVSLIWLPSKVPWILRLVEYSVDTVITSFCYVCKDAS